MQHGKSSATSPWGVDWGDVFNALELGLFTLTRVVVLIAVASLIWVPIGVEIGLRPHLAEKIPAIGAVPCGLPRQFASVPRMTAT